MNLGAFPPARPVTVFRLIGLAARSSAESRVPPFLCLSASRLPRWCLRCDLVRRGLSSAKPVSETPTARRDRGRPLSTRPCSDATSFARSRAASRDILSSGLRRVHGTATDFLWVRGQRTDKCRQMDCRQPLVVCGVPSSRAFNPPPDPCRTSRRRPSRLTGVAPRSGALSRPAGGLSPSPSDRTPPSAGRAGPSGAGRHRPRTISDRPPRASSLFSGLFEQPRRRPSRGPGVPSSSLPRRSSSRGPGSGLSGFWLGGDRLSERDDRPADGPTWSGEAGNGLLREP